MAKDQLFRFKQFSLSHSKSAQKIGTDSVILGSWLHADAAHKILDVGSGCGLLAFMMAQRFSKAEVFGIEKDLPSYHESLTNREASPFKKRLSFYNEDYSDWRTKETFDLIVSNPPYFESGQATNRPARDNARRQKSLSHAILLQQMHKHLSPSGSIHLILPPAEANNFIGNARNEGLYLTRFCQVKSRVITETKRCLFSLSKLESPLQEESLILYADNGNRHPQHAKLTQEFYL